MKPSFSNENEKPIFCKLKKLLKIGKRATRNLIIELQSVTILLPISEFLAHFSPISTIGSDSKDDEATTGCRSLTMSLPPEYYGFVFPKRAV